MNISRKKSKDSEDIHMPGIDDGGGWRTICGNHPQLAERVEELDKSVWSVVRHKNEREEQGIQDSKTDPGVRSRDTGIEESHRQHKLDVAEMRMLRWMCGVTKLKNKLTNERIKVWLHERFVAHL